MRGLSTSTAVRSCDAISSDVMEFGATSMADVCWEHGVAYSDEESHEHARAKHVYRLEPGMNDISSDVIESSTTSMGDVRWDNGVA